MRIGEVAHEAGVGVETIRYYETRGLIQKPLRPADGGFRVYPSEAVHRIRFVRRAQQLGFHANPGLVSDFTNARDWSEAA